MAALAAAVGLCLFLFGLVAGHGVAASYRLASVAILGAVCAVSIWMYLRRVLERTGAAVDAMTLRLQAAARGDLASPCPAEVRSGLPQLATAFDGLIGQVQANLDDVHALAMYDAVTALPNRLYFRGEAERVLAETRTGSRSGLFFIDLDRFKSVNDTLGHAYGDQLLVMVANRLSGVVTSEIGRRVAAAPLIARLAGDEFTILIAEISEEEARRVSHQMIAALTEPFGLAGKSVAIGASIGIAMSPDHGGDLSTLMRAADIAMYHAKDRGRGQVQFYSDTLALQIEDKQTLERALRAAAAAGEFELVFQPQVSAAEGWPLAVEALIRWNHPDKGLQLPGNFMGVAEDSGISVAIGDWVMDNVAGTIARWAEAGMDQRFALNVSHRQLGQGDFCDRLIAALDRAGATLSLVEIEVGENVVMQADAAALEGLARLRSLGVRVSIDNFGTGYTNFARLRDMPVDRLKLDRSLIVDIADSAEARAVAHAVVSLMHGLGYEVVAEGVENLRQIEVLRVIGCDAIQGHAIARPMDETALRHWALERMDRPRGRSLSDQRA
jgi:diguanylate cyclase (GGDEF)-like protein